MLAGTTVSIRDSAGVISAATLSYASPNQVNYRVPENVATGLATVTITAGGVSIPGALNVVAAYPNLFQVNGESLAAAYLVRVRNGQQITEPVYQVSAAGAVTAIPIDLSSATDEVYLILFGTGLGKSSPDGECQNWRRGERGRLRWRAGHLRRTGSIQSSAAALARRQGQGGCRGHSKWQSV
jgi:uncharacterized protein (TIGR03437 family)